MTAYVTVYTDRHGWLPWRPAAELPVRFDGEHATVTHVAIAVDGAVRVLAVGGPR